LSGPREGVDVEDLLGSRGRVRVLRVLSEWGELNITEVGRKAGLNYTSVQRHLEMLKEMGLIREKRYGKIRIFEVSFKTLTVRFERNVGARVEKKTPNSV